jgi:ABC-type uncharacterized transport system permease subunit
MATVFAVFAIVLYTLSSFRQYQAVTAGSPKHRQQVLALGSAAVIFHGLSWFVELTQSQGLNFNFFNVGSLISLVIATLLVASAMKKPLENLFLGIFPMAALILVSHLLVTEDSQVAKITESGIAAHIILSIMAYSILTIAAFQAVLLMIQDHQLKHKRMTGILRVMPPLQTMDRLLFEMLAVGVFLLTLSITSGFLFIDDLFVQQLAHKTVFTILAWTTFVILLIGHWRFGWRGNTASKWTLVGTSLLILAYFGSKFVIEIVLTKA